MRSTIIVLGLLVLVAVVVVAKQGKRRETERKTEETDFLTKEEFTRDWSGLTINLYSQCSSVSPSINGVLTRYDDAMYSPVCGTKNEKKRFLDILKKTTGHKEDERIVGGVGSSENEWPWLAAIGDKYEGYECGASLINEQFVITAAHCLNYYREHPCRWNIRLGEHNLNTADVAHVDHEAENMWIHPLYYSRTMDYDIAVIKLKEPVDYYSTIHNIHPICMPHIYPNINRTNCYTAGWGMDDDGRIGEAVRHVHVQILDDEVCLEAYGASFIPGGMICAGAPEAGKGSGVGDSGSPLMCSEIGTSRWVLIGVASWGYSCGNADLPGVYASVENSVHWIGGIIEEDEEYYR